MKLLTAFLDLEFCPVSFDALVFLARARIQAAGRQLHVVIVPKEDGLGGFSRHWGGHDEAAARWRLWHIVIAACPLAECTVTLAATRKFAEGIFSGRAPADSWWPEGKTHFIGPIVRAARDGVKVPLFRATQAAKRYVGAHLGGGDRVITLTLRNHHNDPARNADKVAWDKFARHLLDDGRRIVVLDDTNDALNAGRGYYEADIDLRLALYESAVMNVVGNNGPAELMKLSSAPYMAFDLPTSGDWAKHLEKYSAMKVGDQIPWATPNQRLVYKPSTFANLREEFERLAYSTRAA